MSRTLLLRLAGPMQSWGAQSRFREREAGREPSKSGVVGLLCAALGKPRDEGNGDDGNGDKFPALARLAALRMGVRVDREGALLRDYHTAGGTHGRA
ncbi:MAG: type I-E CRISPR-associated protein Cas5/CasD, partial [Pyrinomonadaceae bacterium]